MASRLTFYLNMVTKLQPAKAVPKIWNYLKYRCQPRKPIASISRNSPQIASLLLTKRCNMSCSFCNAANFMHDHSSTWQESEADLAKVQKIFENPLFSRALLVDLLGGEPMLVKELVPIVAFLAGRGHLTNLKTNGLLLADRIADLKKAGISRISVSVYEANRAALEKDLPRINKIYPVHTNTVLLRKDVESAPEKLVETVRFLKESGCLDLRFWMYRPMGEHPDPAEVLFDTDPAYLAFRSMVEQAAPGFCFWPPPTVMGPIKKLCPQLWQRTGCDMQGNMGICCGIDTMLSGPGGNLFEGDPDTIFNHPTVVRMREQLLDPQSEPPEVCKNCNLLGDPGW